MIHIQISKKISLADEKLTFSITNLSPYQKINMIAETHDYLCINDKSMKPNSWQSSATFIADEKGSIYLNHTPAIAGDYVGIDGMGILNNMAPVKKPRNKFFLKELTEIPLYDCYHVLLTVYSMEGVILGQTTIKRYFLQPEIKTVTISEPIFQGRFFFHPGKKAKTIIVLSGSDGRIEKAQTIAQLLASHGFNTLALAYFGLNHLPESLDMIPLSFIENAIDWLKKQAVVDKTKIMLYGRSKGAEMALLAASFSQNFSAVVANTPSCYVFEGLTNKKRNSGRSSWQNNQQEVPFIKFNYVSFCKFIGQKIMHPLKTNLSDMYKIVLKDTSNPEKYMMPVQNISAPLLLLGAKKDEIWPSATFANIIVEKMDHSPNVKNINYPTGHFLTIPYQAMPPDKKRHYADISAYQQACEQAWQETLAFYKNI